MKRVTKFLSGIYNSTLARTYKYYIQIRISRNQFPPLKKTKLYHSSTSVIASNENSNACKNA